MPPEKGRPSAFRGGSREVRLGVNREGSDRGEANGSAAPWRGCPLGLVHLHLREFCFCRKLEEARVG